MPTVIGNISRQLIAPRRAARTRYRDYKELLRHDRRCHELLAELEEFLSSDRHVDPHRLRIIHRELSDGVSAMVACLNRMAPAAHFSLRARYKKIDFYGRIALTPLPPRDDGPFILPLDHCFKNDQQAGGKGLHLSLIKHRLRLPTPDGFIISTAAFSNFIEENSLRGKINDILAKADIASPESLTRTSRCLSDLIRAAQIPAGLKQGIEQAVAELSNRHGCRFFAVRSSAVGEDSDLSFAGQYESLLAVRHNDVLDAYRRVLASKYSPRSLFYRIRNGLFDEETPMAVLVLEMIDATHGGVLTTHLADEGTAAEVVIHSTSGLADRLLGGQVAPRTIRVTASGEVFRPASMATGEKGKTPSPVCRSAITAPDDGFTDDHAARLADWARTITTFFHAPQEIEWCLDKEGAVLLLQTRRSHGPTGEGEKKPPDISGFSVLLKEGKPASGGVGCGEIFLLNTEEQLATVPDNAVLVTPVIPPGYVPVLARVSAVVADLGCPADHFSSVARELGVPLVVGTGTATATLVPGRTVTVWGEGGLVLAGRVTSLLEKYPSRQGRKTLPSHHALAKAAPFLFPLKLINPADPDFVGENCRSLHDIIRFVHEKGVQAMFHQTGQRSLRRKDTFSLQTGLPLALHILDLGGGVRGPRDNTAPLFPDDLLSTPLSALLHGLTHPGISWRHDHFDWKNFGETIMGDGIVSHEDPSFASYALVSADYLNLNMRFGYHFAVLDCLCGAATEENYIMLRFAGGGGDDRGIGLRLFFLGEILKKLGFSVAIKADLLDARLLRYNETIMRGRLDMVGRLLGATRLLDMVITDEEMARDMIDQFMNGRYDFFA